MYGVRFLSRTQTCFRQISDVYRLRHKRLSETVLLQHSRQGDKPQIISSKQYVVCLPAKLSEDFFTFLHPFVEFPLLPIFSRVVLRKGNTHSSRPCRDSSDKSQENTSVYRAGPKLFPQTSISQSGCDSSN